MPDQNDKFKEFLKIYIENIDRLRILLLMYKEPLTWSAEKLATRLDIVLEKVITELKVLLSKNLIALIVPETYGYSVASPHHIMVQQMALFDQEKPVTLIKLIYNESVE